MVRHINDHVPTGAAVTMSEEQIGRLEAVLADMFTPLREVAENILTREAVPPAESVVPAPVAVLSTEQFDELKALLQPGFELSKLMLADYTAQRAASLIAAPGEKDPPLTSENLQS